MGKMLHLMTDTVTKASVTGVSNAGDETLGAQSTIKARVEQVTLKIVGLDGNEAYATSRFATENAVTLEDRFWLPGDNTGESNDAKRPLRVNHSLFPGSTEGIYVVYL